jgi:hypothetical protein
MAEWAFQNFLPGRVVDDNGVTRIVPANRVAGLKLVGRQRLSAAYGHGIKTLLTLSALMLLPSCSEEMSWHARAAD